MGCINEGPDKRFLHWLICPLQNLCSWKSQSLPKWVVEYLPTFGLAFPPYLVIQKYNWLFRIGWRYDVNWQGYIFPTVAFKRNTDIMEKGY